MWPGLETAVPNDKIPIIKLGLLYPATDANGYTNSIGDQIKNGFEMGVSEINSENTILNNYEIQILYIDTLLSDALAPLNLKQYNTLNILGYIGPFESALSLAYAEASALTYDLKPIVSYGSSVSNLSDSTLYPTFLRTIQSDGLQAVAIAMFLNLQNWNNIGVIYSADDSGSGIYSSFVSNVETLGILILNNEKTRGIPYNFNKDGSLDNNSKENVKKALNEIVRNQIKIIVYLGNELLSVEVAKQAFDKELYGPNYC